MGSDQVVMLHVEGVQPGHVSVHDIVDALVDVTPSELLYAAGDQCRTPDPDLVVESEESIILPLVAHHLPVPSADRDADAVRHLLGERRNKGRFLLRRFDPGRGDEEHAVRIHLDDFPPFCPDLRHHGSKDLLTGARDLVGLRIVVEQCPCVAEVSIEGIDEDLVGGLHGVEAGSFAGILFPLHRPFGVETERGEVLQELEKDAQIVAVRGYGIGEHDRRVQRLDVGVDNGAENPHKEDVRVAAARLRSGNGAGEGVFPAEILADEESLDLGRSSDPGDRAVRERKHLRQIE